MVLRRHCRTSMVTCKLTLLFLQDESATSGHPGSKRLMSEADLARRECKARSVLNKFKEMENKVLNGEEDDGKKDGEQITGNDLQLGF
jgi:hypothetical protein